MKPPVLEKPGVDIFMSILYNACCRGETSVKLFGIINIARFIYAVVAFVLIVTEDINNGEPGAQKKELAIVRIREAVTVVLGHWPVWVPEKLLSWAIDWLVSQFNTDGTFRKGA